MPTRWPHKIITRDDADVEGNLAVTGTTTATGAITANGGVVGDITGDITGVVGATLTVGSGISSAAETFDTAVVQKGGYIETSWVIDLTGLNSSAAGDIIGDDGVANCHWGQITAAVNGTPTGAYLMCLETPAGGEPDIDVHSATEATGTEDAAVSGLTNTELLAAAADWTAGTVKGFTALPAANEYIYLVGSGAGTDATYTAGKFLMVLYGT